MIKYISFIVSSFLLWGCTSDKIKKLTPLEDLMEGNKRFVKEQFKDHSNMKERIMSFSKKQTPKAIIISCSDSRVPPEIIFDQCIGDLFVIRVAGNVAGDEVIGSVEYAVKHLGVNFIMVLGHERCGAIMASVEDMKDTDHITLITDYIGSELPKARKMPGILIDNLVKLNVLKTIEIIKYNIDLHDHILSNSFKKRNLEIVGARYDLDYGVVEIIEN